MKRKRSYLVMTALALSLALVSAACAGGRNAGAGSGSGSGESLTGELVISGSSTVEPISVAVAEKFNAQHPDVNLSISGPGTSDGFEQFCSGETVISDASRAIEEEEIAKCEENGIEFIELHIATDGISVVTSVENDFATCLNYADLWALLGPESEGFDTWADANQLGKKYGGSAAPYPNEPLAVTAPGEESGTFGSFIEIVLESFVEDAGIAEYEEEVAPRPDYQASANDNVIIEGISGTPSSLGWVGFAFYVNNQDTVKALEIDGGDGCVAPTEETIASFDYPISRPLFIYVDAGRADDAEVEAFVDYYLSDEGIASATEVGYVAIPEEDLEETRSIWDERTTGTHVGE
ncbi:MAG: phosphate ABC transporter substrate-binding protein PstS family protein [Actinobacteria bacterium]|nr:phosphate ABC transporter substrate-binding protein PstS family protein [Actinomycetota bacterium]